MTWQLRNRYSDKFKPEALKLAEKASVARQLGMQNSQVYSWRPTARKNAQASSREAELAILKKWCFVIGCGIRLLS